MCHVDVGHVRYHYAYKMIDVGILNPFVFYAIWNTCIVGLAGGYRQYKTFMFSYARYDAI